MPPAVEKRDFISVQDLSNDEIEVLFAIADRMQRFLRQSHGLLAGYIMGSLFLEPSTRTRLSFESAMNRLGGRVLTLSDARSSSIAKGESLADSVRTVSCYTDIIVLRHPHAGAARIAAEYAPVPVINAGDGGHEHPTQTLCDLYTLRNTKGGIRGLRVILYGDLKYGRTTHSLATALIRFGADVLCVAEPSLELPSYVSALCESLIPGGVRDLRLTGHGEVFGTGPRRGLLFSVDPDDWGVDSDVCDLSQLRIDAIYVTRLQQERLDSQDRERTPKKTLPRVDTAFLELSAFSNAVVLHPLPRLDEIDYAVDDDPRGIYFEQAAHGVPIRMALLSFLLGRESMRAEAPAERKEPEATVDEVCRHPGCVVNAEGSYVDRRGWTSPDGARRCGYCDEVFLGNGSR